MRRPELSLSGPQALHTARELGEAIRQARLARNDTMAEFAAGARMSAITLARIEHGDVSVGFSFWLSAMDAGSILHLLTRVANPSQRNLENRRRATGKKRRPAS